MQQQSVCGGRALCLESDIRSALVKPPHILHSCLRLATHVSTAVTASRVEVVQQGPAAKAPVILQ